MCERSYRAKQRAFVRQSKKCMDFRYGFCCGELSRTNATAIAIRQCGGGGVYIITSSRKQLCVLLRTKSQRSDLAAGGWIGWWGHYATAVRIHQPRESLCVQLKSNENAEQMGRHRDYSII